MLTKDQINKLKRARGLILSVCKETSEKIQRKDISLIGKIMGSPEQNFLEVMDSDVLPSIDAAIEDQY